MAQGADFFVSYTGADRAWAQWVAWQLEQTGYRVIVHAWDFEPGDNLVARMRDALEHADRALALGLGLVGLPIVGHACGRR
jgi:hypothetical protein